MARVLIADDALFVRHVLREMLEAGGHEVVAEATTADETVDRHADHRPDVAIIDVNMPGDGFVAAEMIRKLLPHAPLIVATVYVSDAWRNRAEGICALFLNKPFRAAELLEAVRRATRATN